MSISIGANLTRKLLPTATCCWRRYGRSNIILDDVTIKRHMALYAVGDGWTGALTKTHSLERIPGHFDDDDVEQWEDGSGNARPLPALVYSGNDIQQASAGWGCSAILDDQGQVQLVGRPHDLISLFRLKRTPKRIRNWIMSRDDPSDATVVGTIVSKLIGWASGSDESPDWEVARRYSLLPDWTKVDYQGIGDSNMTSVVCSAGFMAMIGASGTLYTMGINNRGQCGTGTITNNVWTPAPVAGLTLYEKKSSGATDQEEAIIQVDLGFQHGYALTKSGHVFSWGKGSRGQLGREIHADQDATAYPLVFDELVTRIAAGSHHGALVTGENQVFVWGKNMSRIGLETSGKATDASTPELVVGLPEGIRVQDISCGSHHTSILLEDGSVFAVGIASDEAVPLLEAVELIPAGTLDLPLRQFEAHHDRTTIIDKDGFVVLQMHLWKDESLREYASFSPSYVDALLDEGQSIRAIHRGWLHTIVVTA